MRVQRILGYRDYKAALRNAMDEAKASEREFSPARKQQVAEMQRAVAGADFLTCHELQRWLRMLGATAAAKSAQEKVADDPVSPGPISSREFLPVCVTSAPLVPPSPSPTSCRRVHP
eukprot:gene40928-32227_t